MSAGPIELRPLEGLPEIGAGDPLGELIAERAALERGDILAVAQKAVSKAEGRIRDLSLVEPGARAVELARRLEKDPRLVELILAESRRIVRAERGVLIVETRAGPVCANAGIDSSNVPGADRVALLPEDPDRSARRLRAELRKASGAAPAVLITDSFGRPWRLGQSEVAIGCAGLAPLQDWRGCPDRDGRELAATEIAMADELAAAADLARDKVSGTPAVLIRGLGSLVTDADGPGAAAIVREPERDLFR